MMQSFSALGCLPVWFREEGWRAHLATMTPGDCGSMEHSPEEISSIRRQEGEIAAREISATVHCLEERDLLVFYDKPTLEKVTELIRQVRPSLVLTHSPEDYMLDHEMTSQLTRAACFNAPIPNFKSGDAPALDQIPHLYYCDPIEGKNQYGHEIPTTTLIDITSVLPIKERMLACHASQREWLLKHHGMDQYILAMKEWSQKRGAELGRQVC